MNGFGKFEYSDGNEYARAMALHGGIGGEDEVWLLTSGLPRVQPYVLFRLASSGRPAGG